MTTKTHTLQHALHQGATLITPNNRLSNQLLRDYFYHYDSPHTLIEKPPCLPYQTFLRKLYTALSDQTPHINHPILLSTAQEHLLWQQILRQQSYCAYHDGLLKEIQNAWSHCQHWQIKTHDPAYTYTPQTRQFQHWQTLFQAELKRKQAITGDQLVDYLLAQDASLPTPSKQLIWVCFDDFNPQQQALQQTLSQQGVTQDYYDLQAPSAEAYQYKARDPEDEWQQMILWAKARLAAGDQRIILVIPDLQQVAPRLQRFLKNHFSEHAYNLSLGKNLLQYPLVNHALEWLALNETLSHQQACLLLQSPYLHASQHEYLARSEWLDQAPLLRESTISTSVFYEACQTKAPELSGILKNQTPYPEHASLMTWASLFKQRLAALGFPGEYSLDSESYQCFQRFMTLFDEFIALSVIQSEMPLEDALNALRSLAQQTIFQYKQPETSVLILGLLEASGCQADSMWICGLTDQCLPQSMHLSAFIPHPLQRQLDMPHASNERELRLAKQLIDRLQSSCQHLIFSYPGLTGEQPNLPSPLIASHLSYQALTESVVDQTQLIEMEENYQLPLVDQEQVTGGTALLANQAQCPFKAFAAHRLHAKAPEAVQEGLDARDRGQLIHRILESVWQVLKTQQALLALSHSELDNLLKRLINQTLNHLLQSKAMAYPPLLRQIETARLLRLLHVCLEWEKQRPAFEVLAIEQTETVSLADLTFHIRMDRVDQIHPEDPSQPAYQCVIDYKTSLPLKPWREERPEAPQLLLYALTNDHINALLFLQLKSGRVTCQGFSEDTLSIDGVQTIKKDESWSDFQVAWQQRLTDLAEEFKQGQCTPTPLSTTCQVCAFQNLCRI